VTLAPQQNGVADSEQKRDNSGEWQFGHVACATACATACADGQRACRGVPVVVGRPAATEGSKLQRGGELPSRPDHGTPRDGKYR